MPAEVKILVVGMHAHINDSKLDARCTTTLIKSNINIIVDPGSYANKEKLIDALRENGLELSDVNAVILTHAHLDHTANIFLFPQAKIFLRLIYGQYLGQYQILAEGSVNRYDLLNSPISDGVRVLETTGHSADHISVLVNTKAGKVIIAGDAVANKDMMDEHQYPPAINTLDMNMYIESRKRILEMADYIIPGHGDIFKVKN